MNPRTKREQLTARALRLAMESVQQQLYPPNEKNSLSPSQFAVLEELHRQGELNQRTLARAARRSSGNMTVVIDNLERKGLVSRNRSDQDRRVVNVCLTPGGTALIERHLPTNRARLASAFSSFDDRELELLGHLCSRLSDHTHEEESRITTRVQTSA